MTLFKSGRRQLVRALGLAGVAAAGYVFGITSDRIAAQPPGAAPQPLPPAATQPVVPMQPLPAAQPPAAQPPAAQPPRPAGDGRVVAYIYGNVPVTREELGEFLIVRGGYEKLELLVNKKIVEVEAARRNVTVTPAEIAAAFNDDIRTMGITKDDFVKHILPRKGMTLFEYCEDIVKPRLILTKMCRDRIKITDDDLKKLFDHKYGERRQARIICWNREDLRAAQGQWADARKGEEDFIRIAKQQADPNLAAAAGLVAPVGRHAEGTDKTVENILFALKVGEMSQLVETPAGIICVRLHAIVPPDANAKFDDKMKEVLFQELLQRRIAMEIPVFFKQLRDEAKPNVMLKTQPTTAEFREGVQHLINQAGGVPQVPNVPGPAPTVPKQ